MAYPHVRSVVQVACMTDAQLLTDVQDCIWWWTMYQCHAGCWDHEHHQAPHCCCDGLTFERIKRAITSEFFEVAGTRVTDQLIRQALQQAVDADDEDIRMTSKTINGVQRWVTCTAFDEPEAVVA
jgi:hypothetical protein